VLGIAGPNGAGKTSLLRVLLGELKPLAGVAEWGGRVRKGTLTQHESFDDEETTPYKFLRAADPMRTEQQLRNLLGAMVLGEPGHERIALNHQWLWRGKTRDRKNPQVAEKLADVRKLFFEGKIVEASRQANEQLGSTPPGDSPFRYQGVDEYQPFGDLFLHFPSSASPGRYRRELDLSTGIVRTTEEAGGVTRTQEVFASRKDGVLVVRLSADRPGSLSGAVATDVFRFLVDEGRLVVVLTAGGLDPLVAQQTRPGVRRRIAPELSRLEFPGFG